MIHCFTVHQNLPALKLEQNDVILIEPGDAEPTGFYRSVALDYAMIQNLLDIGMATASPTARVALAELVGPPARKVARRQQRDDGRILKLLPGGAL
jgi:hypothetical protein